jgi:hypothetical protein
MKIPAFAQTVIDKIKGNKIIVAVVLAVAAGVDYYFGLGVTATVLDLFAAAPEVVAP